MSLIASLHRHRVLKPSEESRARAVVNPVTSERVADSPQPPSLVSWQILGGGGDKCARAAGKGRLTTAVGAGGARKRVKFCAFDLSTVDMPCEAIQDSEVPGETSQRFWKLWEVAVLRRGGDGTPEFALPFLSGAIETLLAVIMARNSRSLVCIYVCHGVNSLARVTKRTFRNRGEL